MDLRIVLPVLSVLYSGVFHAALPASLGEVSTRHSRPKRCSCATFLDKECVYFCHLDIIWVNTPERTVSYGLGDAPRKKRSVPAVVRAATFPRCECADSTDGTCVAFCRARNQPRRKAARDKVIPSAGGHDCAQKKRKHDLAAKTSGIKGRRNGSEPSAARATRQLQLLLKERSLSHITQAGAAENTTSTRSDTRHRTSRAMRRKGLSNSSPKAARV